MARYLLVFVGALVLLLVHGSSQAPASGLSIELSSPSHTDDLSVLDKGARQRLFLNDIVTAASQFAHWAGFDTTTPGSPIFIFGSTQPPPSPPVHIIVPKTTSPASASSTYKSFTYDY